MFLNIFAQFFNLNISIVPVCVSMEFVPVVDNIQMEGTVSQIFDIGHSFYFAMKNGKHFVTVFLIFTLYFIK